MTDRAAPLHPVDMLGLGMRATAAPHDEAEAVQGRTETERFLDVYSAHFPFVWRSVQRLGVQASQVDDAVQEVFVVVHRRLADFEDRSTLRTWLYGIAIRVARAHRTKAARAERHDPLEDDDPPLVLAAPERDRPDRRAEDAEAARVVQRLLDGMDDELREVFVLAELEELPAPEIAEALEVKVNTVYSRLRLARAAFAEAAARHRARDEWRMR